MNKILDTFKEEQNYTLTENGAGTYRSTADSLMDLFALGGSYRNRSDADCILLFKQAYDENPEYALKCLFYLRDIIRGQGERRFFRVCYNWLANEHFEAAVRNLEYISEYGRWDDFFALVDTPLENLMWNLLHAQLIHDMYIRENPSLLAKWLPSENTSSAKTRALAKRTRNAFRMTAKQYRKCLSILRKRIRVLERLMSENKWSEIEYDKIPSRAGLIYRNAFMRHDPSYKDFAKDKTVKVNAGALYPYAVVKEALKFHSTDLSDPNRLMINKYWDNLTDVLNGYKFNGLAVVDVSGSMLGTPMHVAISLGLYCAERCKGPFANHFFTFSERPQLVEVKGIDFVDKVQRMEQAHWGMNTNIEAVFDKMLQIAINNHLPQSDIPANLIILSDMQFDHCVINDQNGKANETLFETIEREWNKAGYEMPLITFWNLDARGDNAIPMRKSGHVQFVSGFSQNIFDLVVKGVGAEELMFEKLNSERYAAIK